MIYSGGILEDVIGEKLDFDFVIMKRAVTGFQRKLT